MEGVREYLGILRLKVNNGVRKRSVHCQGGQYVLPCRMCLSLAGGCGSVRSSNTQRTVLCNQTLCWGQGWFWVHRVQQWKDAALQPSQLPTAAAVAEGQHKAKGLGEGEYTSYLQEIWSQVAFLFPFSGALHLSMPGITWTRCAYEKVNAEQRDIAKEWSLFSWTVQCVVVFSVHMEDSCWPLMVFVEHDVPQLWRLLWHELSLCQLGKQMLTHSSPATTFNPSGDACEETDPYNYHWQDARAELNADLT